MFFFWSTYALGDLAQTPLSPLALFHRCYAHITQSFLPYSHPLRAQVIEGRISPTEACLEVLDSAHLTSDGRLKNNTSEGRQVLKSFNDFHRSWFPNDNLFIALPQGELALGTTRLIQDEGEGALHVTRSLFTDAVPYSELITGDSGLEAIRTGGPKTDSALAIPSGLELVQIGELLGIRKLSQNPNKIGKVVYRQYDSNKTLPILVNESLGGGIIGAISYMLLNFGRSDDKVMDGALSMPRRWSRAILTNLMCRDLPVIRKTDAAAYVVNSTNGDIPSFRSGSTCMRCHATMEPIAATARNLSYAWSPHFSGCEKVKAAGYIAKRDVTMPSEEENRSPASDPDYYRRPPKGKLFFRSYDGTLVNEPVTGIPELGQALSNTNDFYACAAARYMEYFTGIKVNLQDIGDPDSAKLSAQDMVYRDQVIHWGQGLKNSQSLRSLISEIINSPIYQKSAMGNAGN